MRCTEISCIFLTYGQYLKLSSVTKRILDFIKMSLVKLMSYNLVRSVIWSGYYTDWLVCILVHIVHHILDSCSHVRICAKYLVLVVFVVLVVCFFG